MKRTVWILIKVLVTLIGFALLRQSGALSSDTFYKLAASPLAVLSMIAVACSYDLIRAVSLYWVLRQTGKPAPFLLCIKAQYIGHFFNFFLPGQAGGFGGKSLYLSRLLGIPWKRSINILSVELMMGFLALTAFTAINVLRLALRSPDGDLAARCWIYAIVSIVLTFGIPIVLRVARKLKWIQPPADEAAGWKDELYRAASWLDRWTLCLQIGLLALSTYFMKCFVLWIAARQLGAPETVDYAAICSSFSLGVMVSLVPIAPGGLITGNLGFASALTLLTGAPFVIGADIYTSIWAVHAILGAGGGLIFLFDKLSSSASGKAQDRSTHR